MRPAAPSRRGDRRAPPRRPPPPPAPGRRDPRSCAPPGAPGRGRGRSGRRALVPSAVPPRRRSSSGTRRRVSRPSMSPLQSAPVPASRRRWACRARATRAAHGGAGGSLPRRPHQLERGHGAHLADEVQAIEQRPAQPAEVAVALARRAPATVGRAPAGTTVAGGDEDRVGGELERALRPHDLDTTLLERLAESVERDPAELRELVEEEDAAMGERQLTRSRHRTTSDEPLRRDRVVGRPERTLADRRVPRRARRRCASG